MSTNTSASFSDWFSLRQMSELEFEKACRGPLPSNLNEAAWGYDENVPQVNNLDPLTFSGIENGEEFFSNYDITKRRLDPLFYGTTNGDGGKGPVRAGIFATDTSSRISSGASYYGIIDLSKNGGEITISVQKDIDRKFSQYYTGNPILSPTGNSYNIDNLPYYPYVRENSVSHRSDYRSSYNIGFRAVRLAPSDN
jgi:hypothetical protein